MAQITITYPDENAVDIRDTLCSPDGWNYQDTINGVPNPESKANFIRRKIAEYVKETYTNAKAVKDAQTAAVLARTQANIIVIN